MGADMVLGGQDLVEQLRARFRELEDANPGEAAEVARRAFRIYGLLAE